MKKNCWQQQQRATATIKMFLSLLLQIILAAQAQAKDATTTNYFLPSKKVDVETEVVPSSQHQQYQNVRGLASTTVNNRSLKKKSKKEKKDKSKEEQILALALCVLDKDGYSIEAGSKDYEKGDILYTNSITAMEAAEGTADMLSSMANLSSLVMDAADNDGSSTDVAPFFLPDREQGSKRTPQVDEFISASSMNHSIFSIATMIVGIGSNNDEFVDPSQSLIRDEFKKTDANIDVLSRYVASLYKEYIRNNVASRDGGTLDEMNTQLHRIASAYQNYIAAVTQMDSVAEMDYPDVADKLKSLPTIVYRERFRMVCNEDVTAVDIVGVLYGHACNSDTGTCDYGLKQQGYLLDTFCLGGIEEFKEWIVGAIVLAIFLQQACLPPEQNFCPFENDPIHQGRIDQSIASLEEVLVVLEDPKTCTKNGQGGNGIVLCRVDEREYPIPEDSPEYVNGIDLYSAVNKDNLPKNVGDTLFKLGGVVDAYGSAISNLGFAGAAFGTVLGVWSGHLKLASFLVGRSEQDPTHVLIKQQFAITNAKIDALSELVSDLFDQLREDIGDAILDRLNNQLFRMATAYDDYIKASTLNETTIEDPRKLRSMRRLYREKFKIACNELDFTPKDIIGILYGHACGEKEKYPDDRCELEDGINTGVCEHGIKQRAYLLDKFRKSGNILKIREFKNWMIIAMVEGLFLQAACLPPDLNVCPIEGDPIFEANMNSSIAAVDEVIGVIEATEKCTCPCKKIHFKEFRLANDFSTGDGKPEGWPWVAYREENGDKDIERLNPGYFDDKYHVVYNKDLDFMNSLTRQHTLRLEFVEDDRGSSDNPYPQSFGPADWYDNTCDTYLEEFKWHSRDGDITYTLEFKRAACQEDFCSSEKPDCPDGKSCNFEKFKCEPETM